MPVLLDPPVAGACEDQDLGHRLYIFTAIMFMASRLPPLKRVSRDYRVRRLISDKRLPAAAGEIALAQARHEYTNKTLLTLIRELRQSRRVLMGHDPAMAGQDPAMAYVALRELTKSKFHRQSSRGAAVLAAFTMVVLVVNGSAQLSLNQGAVGDITGLLDFFNRSE